MKRGRFSEEQIIGILREHEAGAAVADLARKYGISTAVFYGWKAIFETILRFAGTENRLEIIDEARRQQVRLTSVRA